MRPSFVTRALACVPIRIGSAAIGVIEVVNPASGAFDSETLEQLDSLASLAGTAIAQARRMAEIQAAEMRFAGLFEDSLDPILISDLNGTITDVNRQAAAVFGCPRGELIGRRITQLHHVSADSLSAGRYKPLLTGQPISYQTRITTREGPEIPVEVHAKLIERGGRIAVFDERRGQRRPRRNGSRVLRPQRPFARRQHLAERRRGVAPVVVRDPRPRVQRVGVVRPQRLDQPLRPRPVQPRRLRRLPQLPQRARQDSSGSPAIW